MCLRPLHFDLKWWQSSHIITHLKQSCWFKPWPLRIADNYLSFWASWWVSASRCDSGSCPPHTLHICPLFCKSRPPCRSLHAVRGGKAKTVNQIRATAARDFYADWEYSAGKMMPWGNAARMWFRGLRWCILETHTRHNRKCSQGTERLAWNN